MNKIDKLIKELCPDGVEWKELGEVCDIKTGKGVTKKDITENASYPIISGGKEPMGYYSNFNRLENTVTISRVGANAGYVDFINEKFYLNDKCFSIIPTKQFKEKINHKLLYYFLKLNEYKIFRLQSEGGVPTINTSKLSSIIIPVPPLPVQQEIVNILDKFTALEAELQAELEARRKQYEYYREKLINYDENSSEVEWKTLGEIGQLIRGNGLQKKDFTDDGVGCIHYGQIYTYYGFSANKTITFCSNELAKKLKKASKGDLIIATTSENIEDVCKTVVWYGDNEIAVSGEIHVLKHNQNPSYIAQLIKTNYFLNYKRKNRTGTKVIRISTDKLNDFLIPLPPLSEQERIVGILDKFEELVNKSLPEEIEARRKQYEYYREKLLTFGTVGF